MTAESDSTNSRRNFLRLTPSPAGVSLLPGCGCLDYGPSVPANLTFKAGMLGLPNEEALDTVRRILLTSAAIPGAFRPACSTSYSTAKPTRRCMSTTAPSHAVLPLSRRLERCPCGRNGRLDPNWADVRGQMPGIAGRAISTMIMAAGYNDFVCMYYTAKRNGVGFHLAHIGTDFDAKLPQPFDQACMRALFAYGYDKARAGYPWAPKPRYLG